jgi:hypothetical protein
MMRNNVLFLILCLSLFALPALADSGARGRVAWRSELIQGVTVRAYRAVEDITTGEPVAVSAPSDQDGIYHLDLQPGSYFLTASNQDGELKPGDLFGYFNGSPLQVPTEGYRNVGFNLIKVPQEKSAKASTRSGIYGEITHQGEPLERVYLYVYKDPGSGFKGLGYFVQPVERGKFRVNLPPGDYYLLARKRARGGQFGPIEQGDFYNYYYGNPVHVSAGEVREAQIEMLERLAILEEEVVVFQGVRGQVVDASGEAQPGLYVFAYRSAEMTGTPDFFSAPSGPDGHFELALPGAGPYYLLARQAFGGPAEVNELYGKLNKKDGHPLAVDLSQSVSDVEITVSPQ